MSTPAPAPAPDDDAVPRDDAAKFEIYDTPQVEDKCVMSIHTLDTKRLGDADVIHVPSHDYEGAGHSIDEIAEAAMKKVPISGTCDVRLRGKLEESILGAGARKAATSTPWDHHASIAFRDLVTAAVGLSPDEQHQLDRDGLVVPARLAYDDYASAYYDIHRAQLPVFVSTDSILHAIYASHDQLLGQLESEVLEGRLDRALGLMHCMLPAMKASYPKQVAEDLDVYLTVARDLLNSGEGYPIRSELGQTDKVREIVTAIHGAGSLQTIELFGRKRAFDATMYTPRGHYEDYGLRGYFRAAMWMSRLEFNLVSRDTRSSQPGFVPDPSETPREAVDALALADLAERSGALADLSAIDHAWAEFAGAREDVSLAMLAKLRKDAGIGQLEVPGSADKLRAAIGNRFTRTINVFPNPNVTHLPVIATSIGPRITADTVALGELPASDQPGEAAANVGFMLGQDRANAYLAKDVERGKLAAARVSLKQAATHDDMYGAWLSAILSLADHPKGVQPAFMATPVFADLRLDTALAAYGQLRHNHVLVAAQQYDVGGCEIPDGYVEPTPAVYTALAAWAKRGAQTFAALDRRDATGGVKYFRRVEHLMGVLAAISNHELAGAPLSAEENRFLAMVVEMRPAEAWDYSGSFPVPTFDGWYLDLFPSTDVAFLGASFIADYATHVHEGAAWIDYLGAKGPHLGMFVVDVGGAPRLMTGPVASAFAATGPVATRFSDSTAKHATAVMPWAASYTVAAPTEPALDVALTGPNPQLHKRMMRNPQPDPKPGIELTAKAELGDATIDLRDHHFVTLGTIPAHVAKGVTHVDVPAALAPKVESIVVHVGDFQGRVDLQLDGTGSRHFGQ